MSKSKSSRQGLAGAAPPVAGIEGRIGNEHREQAQHEFSKINRGAGLDRGQVLDQDLCTGCGACVGLCPYQQFHDDRTTVIHDCDCGEGRCSAYRPRSPADLNGLRAALFDPADLTPELFEEAIRDLMPPSKVPINLEAFEMGRRALVAA